MATMKQLVLAGGGPVHLQLLRQWAGAGGQGLRVPGVQVILVAPQALAVDPARLCGHLAGEWPLEAASSDLAPLAAAAHVQFHATGVAALDATARRLLLGDGQELPYDVLSLDLPLLPDRHRLPGAVGQGLFVRPLPAFVQLWPQLLDLASQRALHAVVIGGGPMGVQLALILAHRFGGRGRVSLVAGQAGVLPEAPPRLRQRLLQALRRRHITVLPEDAVELTEGEVVLSNGARLVCDAPVVALPGVLPPWLADSGLALDETGRAVVQPSLQAASHASVFVPGEMGTRAGLNEGEVPAPRTAALLSDNLHALLRGESLREAPALQRRARWLMCGGRRAIAHRGDWVLPAWLEGLAWRWVRRQVG